MYRPQYSLGSPDARIGSYLTKIVRADKARHFILNIYPKRSRVKDSKAF